MEAVTMSAVVCRFVRDDDGDMYGECADACVTTAFLDYFVSLVGVG